MNLEDIPTPETDEVLKRNAQSCQTAEEDYHILADKTQGLERKLTVARDFIERLVTVGHYPEANGTQIVIDAYAILTATAPKP